MSPHSEPRGTSTGGRPPAGASWCVRQMSLEDLEGVLDGYEAVAAEGRYIGAEAPVDRSARRARWAGTLQSSDFCSFVATAAGEIVGQAGVGLEIGIAELGMWVLDGWRGRGIGSAFLEACIAWARAQGAHKMTLQVWPHNSAAIALYEKYGFEREGFLRSHYRRRNGELWDAVVMGLVLSDGSPGRAPRGKGAD